jgi:cytosine/creatinine deaminase
MNYDLVLGNVHLLDGRAADIAISGDRIAAIEGAGLLSAPKRIDGGGGLCLRPLSDSHIHLDKSGTVQPGIRPPRTLSEAISTMSTVKRAAKSDPEEVRRRMVNTLNGLRRNGTRCVRALVDVDETWGLTGFEAALAARKEIGGAVKMQIVAFAQEGMTDRVAGLLSDAASRGADVIGAHTDVDQDPTNHIRTAVSIAEKAKLPLEVHVDEPATAEHFKLPLVLEYARDVPGLTLVHCLSLGKQPLAVQDRWIREIKSAGATVVVATSVLLFGLPLVPVGKLLDAGIHVAVGSDNLQDVFVPLGTGRLLETVRTVMLAAQLNRPEWMTALLRGATGVGFKLVTGGAPDLEPGSPATFSVFTGKSPSAVLFGEDEIRITVVDGNVEEEAGK